MPTISMLYGVKTVKTLENYRLALVFESGESGIFDMKPYLSQGIFKELRDEKLFRSVHVSFDTAEWCNGADMCPELLYERSIRPPAGTREIPEKLLVEGSPPSFHIERYE